MKFKTPLAVLFLFVPLMPFAQDDFSPSLHAKETYHIDAHYIQGIYYYKARDAYLVLYYHYYDTGEYNPPSEDMYSIDHAYQGRYVKEISRSDKKMTDSDVSYSFASNLEELKEIPDSDSDFIPRGNFPYDAVFYMGVKGDIIYVVPNRYTSGSWGYEDHTANKAYLYSPEPDENFWELNRQGFFAYQRKDYASAIDYFLKSLEINPRYRHSNYNLACMYALTGQLFEKGRPYLEAVLYDPDLQDRYRKKIQEDSDLDAWRDNKDFQDLVGQ